MLNKLKIYGIIAPIAIFFSCHSRPTVNPTKNKEFKGNVILVHQNNKSTFYNEDGLIEKESEFSEEGYHELTNYEYDETGLLLKSIKYYITSVIPIKETTIYGYDNKRRLILKYVYKHTSDDTYNVGDISHYTYNHDTLITTKSSRKSSSSNTVYSKTEHSYTDSVYTEVKLSESYNQCRPIQFYTKVIRKYVNGIEVSFLYNDGEFDDSGGIGRKFINHEFDNYGNWIRCLQVDYYTGQFQDTIKREIIYKGGDISNYQSQYDKVKEIIFSKLSSSSEQDNVTQLNDDNLESNESDNTLSNSSVSVEKTKCFKCNGTGDCRTCSKSFSVHFWDGNGWKDRSESRPGYLMCSTCRGAGVFYKRSDFGKYEIEKECYVGSCNDGWIYCQECNYGGNGRNIGKCNDCKGSGSRN